MSMKTWPWCVIEEDALGMSIHGPFEKHEEADTFADHLRKEHNSAFFVQFLVPPRLKNEIAAQSEESFH